MKIEKKLKLVLRMYFYNESYNEAYAPSIWRVYLVRGEGLENVIGHISKIKNFPKITYDMAEALAHAYI